MLGMQLLCVIDEDQVAHFIVLWPGSRPAFPKQGGGALEGAGILATPISTRKCLLKGLLQISSGGTLESALTHR